MYTYNETPQSQPMHFARLSNHIFIGKICNYSKNTWRYEGQAPVAACHPSSSNAHRRPPVTYLTKPVRLATQQTQRSLVYCARPSSDQVKVFSFSKQKCVGHLQQLSVKFIHSLQNNPVGNEFIV